ncbi:MAG: XdhC family protein [Blastocatellia bacterium]
MLTASEISAAIAVALGEGRALAIVSVMSRAGEPVARTPRLPRLLVEEGGALIAGSLGETALDELAARHALSLIEDEKNEIVVAGGEELVAATASEITIAGQVRLLFEISRPQPEVIICGGGHVGQAVAKAARLLDFAVTVIDDRADFASRDKFPDPNVRLVADDFVAALRALKITPASHVVIVTRGHRHDEICLKEVAEKPARYIGMIGSRRRTTTIREHLRREGVAAEHLRRVYAPIGLDIGAMTPEEIALAILAEIVLVRRGGTGIPKSAEGPMARAR